VLGPPLRTVLELSLFRGLSYQEIAGELGVPTATVSTRLFRARRKLREVLGAQRGTERRPLSW
jgi:RNA polymerase sigma factor (sigma-70 family)